MPVAPSARPPGKPFKLPYTSPFAPPVVAQTSALFEMLSAIVSPFLIGRFELTSVTPLVVVPLEPVPAPVYESPPFGLRTLIVTGLPALPDLTRHFVTTPSIGETRPSAAVTDAGRFRFAPVQVPLAGQYPGRLSAPAFVSVLPITSAELGAAEARPMTVVVARARRSFRVCMPRA